MAHTRLRRARRVVAPRAEALHAHVAELVPLLVAEQGKTLREARLELHKAAETLEHHAGLAEGGPRRLRARTRPRRRRPRPAQAARRRGGDRPLELPDDAARQQARPRALYGNTVVAKPADTTPFTTLRLAEILTEAGLPPGVLNVVTGTGPEAGEALITHPLTRKIGFTGSTPTGERVMTLAAQG